VTHEVQRVICDRCGNSPIGTITAHDVRCGCSEFDWTPGEPPETWFEYRPDPTPLAPGHEPLYRLWRGDPSDPDELVDAYCERHGRVRFTVGDGVAGRPVRAIRFRHSHDAPG
jgi:hypothetical protein